MKQNIIRELAKVTITDIKDRAPLKNENNKKNDKNNLMQIKVKNPPPQKKTNYAIEDLLQDFRPNLTLLNKNPVTLTQTK